VTQFRLEVAGRVVEGQLQERGAARREYDRAIRTGHRAAITEEERPGVFTLRVGNIPPGETVTVQLTLVGPLPCSDGEVTFRFPLVVAPKYIPGTPLPGPAAGSGTASDTDAVPDASRISPPVLLPGYPNPVRLSLGVDVYPSDLPLSDFRCSLHTVLAATDDAGVRRFLLQAGERLDRDFLLRFRVGAGALHTALLLHPDAPEARPDGDGTFLLTMVPPVDPAWAQTPRDLIFVLDRSGSMEGWKMVAARRALARMVGSLTERDRFNVYAFDDRVETPPTFGGLGLVAATPRNRYRAEEFLAQTDSRGGTEMAQPLDLAVHLLSGSDPQRQRILVLVTDGQVGNEDEILRRLGEKVRGVRVFTLGIDKAVNEGFLRRLAELGGGAYELVESEERLEEVLEQVHRRIGQPVLTGLSVAGEGLALLPHTLVPARPPDLFPGTPLFLLGRYRGSAVGAVRLSARDAGRQAWQTEVRPRVCENPAVGLVWARGQVRQLEDRYAVGPRSEAERQALKKQIIETSLGFGVLSRFTAFVAVDREEVVNEGGGGQQVVQPVEPPAGWQAPSGTPNISGVEILGRIGSGGFGTVYRARVAPGYAAPADRAEEELDEGVDTGEFCCSMSGLAESAAAPPMPRGVPANPPPASATRAAKPRLARVEAAPVRGQAEPTSLMRVPRRGRRWTLLGVLLLVLGLLAAGLWLWLR
jgi:Ca-activated chloride channel family protein